MDAIYGSLAAESNTKNPVVSLTIESGGELKIITGRDAWALSELISAGSGGATPIASTASLVARLRPNGEP